MIAEEPRVRLWRVPLYPTWFISDTAKELADALMYFAVPLIALIVTDSPIQAGIIGAVGAIIGIVLILGGGVLADRHDRPRLMLLGAVIGIALTGGFALLDLADALTFTGLLALSALLAARNGLFDVAGEAALKDVVPDAAMGRAQASNQGRGAVIGLVGGPLGGILLAVGGWLVALVAAACHLVGAVTAWMLRRARIRRGSESSAQATPNGGSASDATSASPTSGSTALTEIREGFVWLLARADLRGVMWIALIVNLGFNAAVTTIIYSLQQAGHSTVVIGLMSAAIGVFMLAGALIAPLLITRIGGGIIVSASLTISMLGTAALPFVESVPGVLAVVGGSLLLVPALNSALLGYFMVAVPTAIIGRANSAVRVLTQAALPLAPLIAGFGLAWLGRPGTLVFCATLTAIAVALAVGNKALRALPIESRWAEHAKQYEVVVRET